MEAPSEVLRPIASVSLSAGELAAAGIDNSDWIAYARHAAGTAVGEARVVVDGMDASRIVTGQIARISVNTDPFAAEFAGIDQLRVDVDLLPPDRRWRVQTTLPSLFAGGRSLLAGAPPPATRSYSGALAGPVRGTPLTFAVDASEYRDSRLPVLANTEEGELATAGESLRATSSVRSFAARFAWTRPDGVFRTGWSTTRSEGSNPGAGGIRAIPMADTLDASSHRLDSTWRFTRGPAVQRGGIVISSDRFAAAALPASPHLVVTGQSVRGGPEFGIDEQRTHRWQAKHVVDAPGGRRPWKAGIELERGRVDAARAWNPFGTLQMESPRAGSGVWTLGPAASRVSAETVTAAAFAEQRIYQRGTRVLRAGGRLEWQRDDGVLVSPRISAAAQVSRFAVTGGAGLFVQPIAPVTFATAALRGSEGVAIVLDAPAGTGTASLEHAARLRSLVDPAFTRARHAVFKGGIAGRFRLLQIGVEETFTAGTSLAGSVRERDEGGLTDVLRSDRSLRRFQTHVRATVTRGAHSITARYEHVHARDNSEAAFVLPAIQSDVRAEWAPSAGVPAHLATLTAAFRLPWTWRLTLTADARAGSRFNAISGRDEEGLGTFTGRAGLPRNSGILPASRTLSAYASRQIRLKPLRGVPVAVGIRADNLFNRVNVLSVGRVLGSPLYGRPLSAAPARSIRVWATLAR